MQLQTSGHITVPRYRYMGTEDLILDLEIMSNIYQCQIINLQLARHRARQIEGWRHSTFTEDKSSSWRPCSRKRSHKQNLHAKI